VRDILLIGIVILLLAGCPGKQAGADETAAGATPVTTASAAESSKHLVIICSATESDPWTHELLTLAGSQLGFDPWSTPATSGHLDLYGPYDAGWQGKKLKVTIALAGLTTVAELLPQQALGAEARDWLASQGANYIWLDGDPAQLQIGAQLLDGPPIFFTGVVNDRELYYSSSSRVTGVYRRHSLSGVLGVIWALDPERFKDDTQARRYALITDDSPTSISRASRYAKLEAVLPTGHTWIATPAAHSWAELRGVVKDMQSKADALIFCGVGENNCNAEFLDTAPPADLLAGNKLPAVVLGPSRIDQCGATVLAIKTSAAVDEALERLGKLLAGETTASMGLVEPREMGMYQAAGADTPTDKPAPADK
jgi:hypothetical protein